MQWKEGKKGEKEKRRKTGKKKKRYVVWGILGSTKGFFSIHCRGSRAWEWRGFRYLVTL